MSSTYIPGNGVPLPEQQKPNNGCMKYGAIGGGILVLLALIGSCGNSETETIVETETVTVTSPASASTVTVTETTTVAGSPTSATTTQVEQQQAIGGANEADGSAGAGVSGGNDQDQRAQFFAPAPPPPAAPAQSAYYGNCDEARSAGASPLYAGDPGYRSGLDRDGDGVACE